MRMTTTANGSHSAQGTSTKPAHSDSGMAGSAARADEFDTALSALHEAPAPAKPGGKRGRKPGTAAPSAHERLQKQLAAIETARTELRRLELEALQKTRSIVGAAVLEIAERDDGFRQLLLGQLRNAPLSASEKKEIAHIFVSK